MVSVEEGDVGERERAVRQAYERSHDRLVGRLRRRGFGAEAEDIVNDAWIQTLRVSDLDIDRDLESYVWTIALRLAWKSRKAGEQERRDMLEVEPLVEECAEDPQEAVCRREDEVEQRMWVEVALQGLSARQRTVLQMDRAGADTAQIAEEMGLTPSTVHVHRHRGLKNLRRAVEGELGQEGV